MSITSEKQKRYDPTNGGFSYYTLFHADKGERPSFADNGDIVEEFGEGGKAYVCSRDAKGRIKWTEDATWDRQTGGGSGGGSGGSYTLPTASADTKGGVKIGSGLTMTGEVLSATGGGSEKFVVTLTNSQGELTADKTVAEIIEADGDGKIVVASVPTTMGISVEIPLSFAFEQHHAVSFSGSYGNHDAQENYTLSVTAMFDGEADVWAATISGIPSYSSSNNGQVLGVSSGSLAWVDTNAPLIVTLTLDEQAETIVGNKTYGEILSARAQGTPVTLVLDGQSASSVVDVSPGDGTIVVTFAAGGQLATSEGGSTDYFEINMGG